MPSKAENSVKEEEQIENEEGEHNLSSFVKAKKKKKKPLKKDKVDNQKDENNQRCSNKEKQQQQQQKKKNANSGEALEEKIKVKKPNKDNELATEETSNKGEKEKNIKTKKPLEEEEEEEKKKPVAGETNGKKKVFDLPGQKRDPPEERDPLRIFYETLYHQLPHSEMAAVWMMEYGLLPREVAEIVHEKKQMKKNQLKLSSPTKAVASVKKTTKSVTVNKTKCSPGSTAKKTTKSVTVKKTKSSSGSSAKKKSASITELKQSKKRKMDDSASEDETDDKDDFVLTKTKKRSKA